MRDMNSYSEKGRSRLTGKSSNYDIRIEEIESLINDIGDNRDKLYTAIAIAYYCGLESGYRLREKEQSSI